MPMTDDELVEKIVKSSAFQGVNTLRETISVTLTVATPEIERRVLKDMMEWRGLFRWTKQSANAKAFRFALDIYARERGISWKDK